jgi:hypothetical protein
MQREMARQTPATSTFCSNEKPKSISDLMIYLGPSWEPESMTSARRKVRPRPSFEGVRCANHPRFFRDHPKKELDIAFIGNQTDIHEYRDVVMKSTRSELCTEHVNDFI